MTKLAQQFPKSVQAKHTRPDRGWTFKAQKAYQRGRFNNVKPFTCPIFNHKIEQLARAIVAENPIQEITRTNTTHSSISFNFPLGDLVVIGNVKGNTAVLRPESNTALAILGYNGNAVLAWLGGMRAVDELTGQATEVIVNDGEFIYTTIGVVLQLAKDLTFNREAVLAAYYGDKNAKH